MDVGTIALVAVGLVGVIVGLCINPAGLTFLWHSKRRILRIRREKTHGKN